MWRHFVSLLSRAFHLMPSLVSSNWTAVFMAAGIFALSQILLSLRGMEYMKRQWKENIAIGVCSVAVGWIGLFAWSIVVTVYSDHQFLAAKVSQLQRQQGPQGKSIFGIYPDNEYSAISNLIGSFGYLRNSPTGNHCLLKMTSPAENIETVNMIASLAANVGCHLTESVGNPSLDPDVNALATKGAIMDAVVLHARKENAFANGVITDLGNVFDMRRQYDLPAGSRPDLIWLQFGTGSFWRKR